MATTTQVDTGTRTFQAASALAQFLRVQLNGSNKLIVATASDEDSIGEIGASAALAANDYVAVNLITKQGTSQMVAHGAISQEALVYAAAAGRVASSGTIVVGIALNAATAQDDIIEVVRLSQPNTAAAVRTQPIPLELFKTWDNRAVNLPATSATDDLAIITGTLGTSAPQIQTSDLKAAGATSRKAGVTYAVPDSYVDGEAITLRVNGGMTTSVADTTATVDAVCYRQAAPTVDIVATAATTVNSLTAADVDFTLTPTNVVAGDQLDIVLTLAVNDAATGTAVIGTIFSTEILATTKL